MNMMTTAYSALAEVRQQRLDSDKIEDVENTISLSEMAEIVPVSILRPRIREDKSVTNRRNAICLAYENGDIEAWQALDWLAQGNLWGSDEYLMDVYSAGVRALAEKEPRP